MGKTNAGQAGVIRLLDPPDAVRRKVMRAVTDDLARVRYDPGRQPGVSNLVEILAAIRREQPTGTAAAFSTYRDLKRTVADEVIAVLEPLQRRYRELTASQVTEILADGARRARERTATTLAAAYGAMELGGAPPGATQPV